MTKVEGRMTKLEVRMTNRARRVMRGVAALCAVGLLILLLAACVRGVRVDLVKKHNYERFACVAAIEANFQRADHVGKLLESAGIPNIIEGSRVYGVSVPPEKWVPAILLLKLDSTLHGYWLHVEGER